MLSQILDELEIVNCMSLVAAYAQKKSIPLDFTVEQNIRNGLFICVLNFLGQPYHGSGTSKKDAKAKCCFEIFKFHRDSIEVPETYYVSLLNSYCQRITTTISLPGMYLPVPHYKIDGNGVGFTASTTLFNCEFKVHSPQFIRSLPISASQKAMQRVHAQKKP
jgi:hypothetical protein